MCALRDTHCAFVAIAPYSAQRIAGAESLARREPKERCTEAA